MNEDFVFILLKNGTWVTNIMDFGLRKMGNDVPPQSTPPKNGKASI